jgi:hypothetical protein
MQSPIKRKDSTRIPEIDELLHLMTLESPRQVPPDKLYSNFKLIDFSHLIAFLDHLGIEYDKNYLLDSSTTTYDYLPWSIEMMNKVVELFYNNEFTQQTKKLLINIYEYLAEDDSSKIIGSNKQYDIGFVFGSASLL